MVSHTPWAVLLCKYKDSVIEPFPRSLFEQLYTTVGTATQNMVDYFFEISHGNIDISTSQVFGWLTIDSSLADIAKMHDPRVFLVGQARKAAVRAGVDLCPFFGTVVFMNEGGGEGGAPSSAYGPMAFFSHDEIQPALIGQEMGHGYGLNHSMEDGVSGSYMDPWDIMSAWNSYNAPHKVFGAIGPILNASNMRFAKWLDESRVYRTPAQCGTNQTIRLRPLVRRDLSGWLAADLAGEYLVEFRVKEGWDAAIPRPAILVHRFSGADNRSYLMHSTTGGRDLVTGDQFAAMVGYYSNTLSVVDIDPVERVATLSLQCMLDECGQLRNDEESITKSIANLLEALRSNRNPQAAPAIEKQIAYWTGELEKVEAQAKALDCK